MDDFDPRMAYALRFVRRRCPKLSDEELVEAAKHWLAYLDIIWKIHERLRAEDDDLDDLKPRNG